MCGRFIQIADPEKIKAQISDLSISPEVASQFRPRYNIAPTQNILTVLNTEAPKLVYTRWGLIPFWAKDRSMGARMINARGETLLEKSSFKMPFRKKRCIIFADGFYEWKTAGRVKTPFFIRLADRTPFALAGLWDQWTDPASGEKLLTSTIITTTANDLVSTIHDRMPAILKKQDYRTWLNPGVVPDGTLMGCIGSYPAPEMEAFEVSKLMNSPSVDLPGCIEPLSL
jgi:putative SOS response-associated peptidase YedK